MKIIDLTMPITEDMPVFTGSRKPRLWPTATIEKDGWNEHPMNVVEYLEANFGSGVPKKAPVDKPFKAPSFLGQPTGWMS